MGTCSPDRQTQSCGPTATTPVLHAGNDGSIPSRTTFSKRPGTPIGRATRLKPECLQVRPLLWVLKSWKAANQQSCNFLFLHETNGALVQREDVCVASRRSGFDSLVLHSVQSTWLGRQLADHFGLEPEMLWVRVPPELLKPYAGVVSNG